MVIPTQKRIIVRIAHGIVVANADKSSICEDGYNAGWRGGGGR